ncbi:hypothetical protein DS031_17360 [Bacillus taeanensis]|uniref:Uncharacterized protein n=1 Tax=Bacillus taeanensis TaxID=273032 RepID=A0A366XWH2_9BACI|nr:hypothetical protein DS031_17360 [Bacillus taeanensis]
MAKQLLYFFNIFGNSTFSSRDVKGDNPNGLEWIAVKYFHLFTYKTWKSWYSLLFYIPVMLINIIFYNKFHKYVENQRKVRDI